MLNSFDIASYAGNNIPSVTRETIEFVIELLQRISAAIFKWFSHKKMQGDAHNGHVLISTEVILEIEQHSSQGELDLSSMVLNH